MQSAQGSGMNSFKIAPVVFAALALTACGVDQARIDPGEGADDGTYQVNNEALSAPGKFETFVGRDGQTYFHLLAGNGEKVLASQGYASLASALSGIESLKAAGTDASKYLLREASDGAWYFVVASLANAEILAVSVMYVSQYNATRAKTAGVSVIETC